jgi:hypothetical protein
MGHTPMCRGCGCNDKLTRMGVDINHFFRVPVHFPPVECMGEDNIRIHPEVIQLFLHFMENFSTLSDYVEGP